MSRIGRMPIAIPAGVTVEVAENNKVTVINCNIKTHMNFSFLKAVWHFIHLPLRSCPPDIR